MSEIARWTTPSISFKPSMAEAADIAEIKCVLTQSGEDLIIKSLTDATIENGKFIWTLTQAETASLAASKKTFLQFDYLTDEGMRYTTVPVEYETVNSAIDEAIE